MKRNLRLLFILLFFGISSAYATSITGTLSICAGTTTTLSIDTSGGVWSSSNTAAATIDGSGVVTGVAFGNTTISYVVGVATYTVAFSVKATPSTITGSSTVCETKTTALSSFSGNTWTSSNTSFATVNSSGTVTGVSAGAVTITYTNTTSGCYRTKDMTVNITPSAITGDNPICNEKSGVLTSSPSGGTWVSQSTSVATFASSASGAFDTHTGGSSVISYTYNGCLTTKTLTVNLVPATISGTNVICIGGSATLSSTTSNQTWSSSNTAVATVGSASATTGLVTPVGTGVATISYTYATGCTRTYDVTVNPALDPIAGSLLFCGNGISASLSNTTSGGTWSSSNGGVAGVNSTSGLVTSVAAGTSNITYTVSTACKAAVQVTVSAALASISGTTNVCVGSSATLTTASSGGTWASSNTATASVDSSTGVVTGVASGNVTISYIKGGACYKTFAMTVNPLPNSITGTSTVCEGSTTVLASATSGGTWSSSNTAVGTVVASGGSAGTVTGVSGGNTTITYKLSATGCYTTQNVTVNPLPSSITGTLSVCQGFTTSLSSSTSGGNWTSTNTSVATVTSGGVVTGVAAGQATISYTLGTGCARSVVVTVNANPAAIGGSPFVVCDASTITLTDATASGTWSSSNTSVATVVSGTGVVTGVAAGNATISYIITATGCYATQSVTVNARPAAITGTLFVCEGKTTTLASATSGGNWTSSSTANATVTSGGVVSGVAAGNATISYTLVSTGCYRTATVTVGVTPTTITGDFTICYGATNTLSSTPSGQTWSSSNTSVATVNASTGAVTGISVGNATITYTHANTCFTTTTVSVLVGPNTGDSIVCEGNTVTLHNGTSGGTWASSSTANATVNSSTGVVSGILAGTSNVTYTLASEGCTAVTQVTVNPAMASITGIAYVCQGYSTTLSHALPGGTWTSSNTGIASVGLNSGVVTGVANGLATITYTYTSGCIQTIQVTVSNTLPGIVGSSSLCIGDAPVTFTHPISGGTWSSSSTARATVGVTTGVVTPVAVGGVTISYSLGVGCAAVKTISVYPVPVAIVGSSQVCVGSTVGLTDYMGDGSWSSATPSIASIGTGSGVVTGVAQGTAVITYTMFTGCYTTRVQTVNYTPDPVVGITSMCSADSTVLTCVTSGGTWSSSNTAVATANSSTGKVNGVNGGLVNISYILPTGCSSYLTVTVGQTPANITGTSSMCAGSSATLTSTTSGGTWTSSNTAVATVGSATGTVTAVAAGVATITYSGSAGCYTIHNVTVNPAAVASTGTTEVCVGQTTTLSNATSGGTWSTGSASVAYVNSTTGVVTGVAVGTVNIYYTNSTGCYNTTVVTVQPVLAAITGTTSVCLGSTTTLAHAVSGGTWSSSNTAKATVNSTTGEVTGVSAGSAIMTYTTANGCYQTATVYIYSAPSAITGGSTVCVGSTAGLYNVSGSGTWSSSNTSVATIGTASGVVTGVASGVATITYTVYSGCSVTKDVTVNSNPSSITGTPVTCVGQTTTLSSLTTGGTWSVQNTSIATAASGGVITGVSAGNTNVVYTDGNGCSTTASLTVGVTPAAISGSTLVCLGSTTTLSSTPTGFTWSSDNTSVATVSGGVVTPVASGVANISYTHSSGCARTVAVTVNNLPAITGASNVCQGANVSFSGTPAGGTWSSSNTAAATVTSTGLVSGVASGIANITYATAGTGCYNTQVVSVSAPMAAITGTAHSCIGTSSTLSNTVSAGTWSSSNTSVATVGAATGIVTGVAAGTATITYASGSGCNTTIVFTVNSDPAAISGTGSVCSGSWITLSNATTGGTWSTTDTTVATIVTTTGRAYGVSAGVASVTYTMPSGCFAVATITVNAAPASITGTASTCIGQSATLACATSGGVWSSSNTAVATVNASTGVVTGVAGGVATITYSIGGCYSTVAFAVSAAPSTVSGTLTVCVGSATSLSAASGGGVWSTSDSAKATVSATGVVTGTGTGVVSISYTQGSGCVRTVNVTVNAALAAISGDSVLCLGGSAPYTIAATGGTWSSSSYYVASVGASTGTAVAYSVGTTTISYKTSATCYATKAVTVNAAMSNISGPSTVCVGVASTFTHATTGGTWSTSSSARATVDMTTGVVTGVSAGYVTITYTYTSGCYKTKTVLVSSAYSIGGTGAVCVGSTATLTCYGGGSWSSANSAIATVGSATGIVTGTSADVTTITYTLANGCYSTKTVTVNETPSTIIGSLSACVGTTTDLSTTPTGGTWSSSSTYYATVGSASGTVTGVHAGTARITYALSTGCKTVSVVTVGTTPATISGASSICAGSSTTLTCTPAGGTWSSESGSIATAVTGGVVTGVATGVTTISYTIGSGCASTKSVTVNAALPSVAGGSVVCIGQTTTLSDATSGGTWSSSNTSRAYVNASTGLVTGVSAGTVDITYRTSAGCYIVNAMSVNAVPAAISGTTSVCVGGTSTLSHAVTGGTWSSSNTSRATIDAETGIVTGIATGTATITYWVDGCYKTTNVSVIGSPLFTSAVTSVCVGATTTLTCTPAGGTWSSYDSEVGSIGSSTGVFTGISAGVTVVTYTASSTGCVAVRNMTVNATVDAGDISGSSIVMVGATTTLSATISGGSWSSSAPSVASVVAGTGVVTGVASGSAVITYYMAGTCGSDYATQPVYVFDGSMPSRPTVNNGVETSAQFTLYPNPTTGVINVTVSVAGNIRMYAVDGRQVAAFQLQASGNTISLPSDIADGMYTVRFEGEDGSVSSARLIYKR